MVTRAAIDRSVSLQPTGVREILRTRLEVGSLPKRMNEK
jgi:hypothetical protein